MGGNQRALVGEGHHLAPAGGDTRAAPAVAPAKGSERNSTEIAQSIASKLPSPKGSRGSFMRLWTTRWSAAITAKEIELLRGLHPLAGRLACCQFLRQLRRQLDIRSRIRSPAGIRRPVRARISAMQGQVDVIHQVKLAVEQANWPGVLACEGLVVDRKSVGVASQRVCIPVPSGVTTRSATSRVAPPRISPGGTDGLDVVTRRSRVRSETGWPGSTPIARAAAPGQPAVSAVARGDPLRRSRRMYSGIGALRLLFCRSQRPVEDQLNRQGHTPRRVRADPGGARAPRARTPAPPGLCVVCP